jgi:hypothetical protein
MCLIPTSVSRKDLNYKGYVVTLEYFFMNSSLSLALVEVCIISSTNRLWRMKSLPSRRMMIVFLLLTVGYPFFFIQLEMNKCHLQAACCIL